MNVLLLIIVCVLPYFLSSGQDDITESCPTGTEFYVAGKCLWPVNNRVDFSAAQQECGLSDGVLVDVQDQETNEAVKSIIQEKNFNQGVWIGVHDMTETSRYTNMFNQMIQFSNWKEGEPDEKDSKQCIKVECVQMDTVGKWMDVCCSNSLPAVCSKQLLQFNTSDVTSKSEQISASELTQLTEQQTTSQSTQWTTTDQYSTESTEQQTTSQSTQGTTTDQYSTESTERHTTSQSTQGTTTDQYSTESTEQQTTSQSTQWTTTYQYSTESTDQQTTSQSTKSTLSLAPSNLNLTVQLLTTLADRSSTADVILTSRSQVSMVTETVESASLTLDSTGLTTQLPSSLQLTMTTEPYSSAIHPDLIHTSQSRTNSDEQSTTSESSTESQTTPSTKATRDCFCPCERTKNLLIIESEAQLKAKIDMIREDLAVNKPLLSSSIRRKISVSDSRPSSIVIGSTLGVSLLVLVLVLIFVSDFHHLVTDIRHGLKNIRRAFVFLKRHMWNEQNRTIFASQDFSGPSRSPEHIIGEQF